MSDANERAQRLIRLLISLPADRFTLGEMLFISNRFRYSPAVPEPVGVGNFSDEDLQWLEAIAKRLVTDHAPDVH